MTKEMGRWVEYFEKVENEKGYYVRKVPAWVKAVHLINWDFDNLNETHRVRSLCPAEFAERPICMPLVFAPKSIVNADWRSQGFVLCLSLFLSLTR